MQRVGAEVIKITVLPDGKEHAPQRQRQIFHADVAADLSGKPLLQRVGGAKHLAVNDTVYHAAARLVRGDIAAHTAVKGKHTAIDGKCRRRILSGKRLGMHDRVLLDLHGGIVRYRRRRRLQSRRFAPKMHAAADKHSGKHRRRTDKRRHAPPERFT